MSNMRKLGILLSLVLISSFGVAYGLEREEPLTIFERNGNNTIYLKIYTPLIEDWVANSEYNEQYQDFSPESKAKFVSAIANQTTICANILGIEPGEEIEPFDFEQTQGCFDKNFDYESLSKLANELERHNDNDENGWEQGIVTGVISGLIILAIVGVATFSYRKIKSRNNQK